MLWVQLADLRRFLSQNFDIQSFTDDEIQIIAENAQSYIETSCRRKFTEDIFEEEIIGTGRDRYSVCNPPIVDFFEPQGVQWFRNGIVIFNKQLEIDKKIIIKYKGGFAILPKDLIQCFLFYFLKNFALSYSFFSPVMYSRMKVAELDIGINSKNSQEEIKKILNNYRRYTV